MSAVPEPVRKSVDVAISTADAFRLWTERLDLWWPKEGHVVSGDGAAATMTFETRAGGRLVERARDGREIVWGRVLAWEPPLRLVHSWFPGTDEEQPAQVEITFDAVDGGTRVTVEHSVASMDPDRFAANCEGFKAGWDAATQAFGEQARTQR